MLKNLQTRKFYSLPKSHWLSGPIIRPRPRSSPIIGHCLIYHIISILVDWVWVPHADVPALVWVMVCFKTAYCKEAYFHTEEHKICLMIMQIRQNLSKLSQKTICARAIFRKTSEMAQNCHFSKWNIVVNQSFFIRFEQTLLLMSSKCDEKNKTVFKLFFSKKFLRMKSAFLHNFYDVKDRTAWKVLATGTWKQYKHPY